MKVLGIDTSGRTGTIGLTDGKRVVGEYTLNIEMMHAERLLPMLRTFFSAVGIKPCELDGIGVGLGPGFFTALRIGVTTAKTLAQVLEIPLAGIPTLDVLAFQPVCRSPIVAVIAAGRGEVYASVYRHTAEGEWPERLCDYGLFRPEGIGSVLNGLTGPGEVVFIGRGAEEHRLKLTGAVKALGGEAVFLPSQVYSVRGSLVAILAEERLSGGGGDDLFKISPLYIRRSDAELARQRNKNEVEGVCED